LITCAKSDKIMVTIEFMKYAVEK